MQVSDLSKLVITHVDYTCTVYTEKGAYEKLEPRKNWGLKLKREGRTYYTMPDGREYLSDNQRIILCPKGSTYEWRCETGGWITNIEFDAELEGFDPEDTNEIFSFEINDNWKLLKLFEEIETAAVLRPELAQMMSIKLLYEVILLLLEKSEKKAYASSVNREKIRPAIEYISRFYTQKITNEQLSRQCGISTVYFRKLFTETFGVSPQAYLFRFRMERAKILLMKEPYMRVSEVAVSVGYGDVYQFSKMFKKYTGVPPKRYLDTQKKRVAWIRNTLENSQTPDWI